MIKINKIKPKDWIEGFDSIINKDNYNIRVDGRVEYICEHGVGHTIWYPRGSTNIHGCDGCCNKLTKERIKILIKKARGKENGKMYIL